jgi:hypothetical protein
MATLGTRGKWAEKQVRDWMSRRSETDAGFAFLRYPDARAGSAQPAPSDFEAGHRGTNFKIEVKEVKITTVSSRRLPAANFAADKVGRMRKWRLAGSQCWVIVCHLTEGRGGVREWRLVPADYFFERAASWDLSLFKAYPKVEDVMLQLFP